MLQTFYVRYQGTNKLLKSAQRAFEKLDVCRKFTKKMSGRVILLGYILKWAMSKAAVNPPG